MIYVTPVVKRWDKRFEFDVLDTNEGTARRYYTAPLGRGLYRMENGELALEVPGHEFNLLGTNWRRKAIEFAAKQSGEYHGWLKLHGYAHSQALAYEWYHHQITHHHDHNGGTLL